MKDRHERTGPAHLSTGVKGVIRESGVISWNKCRIQSLTTKPLKDEFLKILNIALHIEC